MNRQYRLLSAIGGVDERYLKEANGKMRKNAMIKAAVVFGVLIAMGLYLFIPYAPINRDLSAYTGSEYFPLIERVEDYRASFNKNTANNNFEAITDGISGILSALGSIGDLTVSAPSDPQAPSATPEADSSANGSYIEATDNQEAGVIESDLFKMTDKYIFRIGMDRETEEDGKYVGARRVLRVYSIDKENSALISETVLPQMDDERGNFSISAEMYLSEDATRITVITNYNNTRGGSSIGVISLDVSDVTNVRVAGKASIEGSLNTSRMVDDRLLLVSEFYFNRNNVDYDDPTTFVPSIDLGDGPKPVRFEDIIFPETLGNTRYSVVTMLDVSELRLLGANALLNFTDQVYVSENNIYLSREYIERQEFEDGRKLTSERSDVAVIGYSEGALTNNGVISVRGWTQDQYSFDELDGYLRVVTSSADTSYIPLDQGGDHTGWRGSENVNLYVFDLSDNSLAYKVEDFAYEGEEATAVRFMDNKLYVCTAVIVNFTDPVYFFDLTDYENISFSDTGIIEGYSTSLIDFGEGFALGIGPMDWQYNKVEIYELLGDSVVGVDMFKFEGVYSTDYKSYLVNRDERLFGFGINDYHLVDQITGKITFGNYYALLYFNGYNISCTLIPVFDLYAPTVRAAYLDGYLYVTTDNSLTVERID